MERKEAIRRIIQNKAAAQVFAAMTKPAIRADNSMMDMEAFDMAVEALGLEDLILENVRPDTPGRFQVEGRLFEIREIDIREIDTMKRDTK